MWDPADVRSVTAEKLFAALGVGRAVAAAVVPAPASAPVSGSVAPAGAGAVVHVTHPTLATMQSEILRNMLTS